MAKKKAKKKVAKKSPRVFQSKELRESTKNKMDRAFQKAGFVFIGNPQRRPDEYDAVVIEYRGHRFELNGEPVVMTDRVDERFFANHPHFKKV